MARHRSCSIAFKRQVVQEFLGGEALYGLARRHDVSRNLLRVWVAKYEAGALMTSSGPRSFCRSTKRDHDLPVFLNLARDVVPTDPTSSGTATSPTSP